MTIDEQRNIKLEQIIECVACDDHFIRQHFHRVAVCFGVNVQAI